MPLQIQTTIDNRYQILAKLGQGGMGAVYEAHDRLSKQRVALKLLEVPVEHLSFASKNDTPKLNVAIINEFRILSGLRHPNIISVYDYGLYNRTPYIVMELLSNAKPFDDAIDGLSDSEKVQHLIQVLLALAYLHRRGIIHRDLKPSNILVVNDSVKVLDFGLSATDEIVKGRAGTLAYMAPETLAKSMTVAQSDLYSFGLVAYKAFLGHLPFEEHDILSMIETAPDTSKITNSELEMIISRLLMKNPLDRYSRADDVVSALKIALDLPIRESGSVRESFLQASKFVGREEQIEVLNQALCQAMQGQGSSWLVGGESGVGKSRLFDEFRTHALTAGMPVLRGQGVEGGGLPYQLWRDMLRRLVLSSELSSLEASILKEVVPDIGELLDKAVADAPLLQGEAQKLRLIATIVDLLKKQQQPIVLLLEDLHWMSNSLEVLKRLNSIISEMPLLIVASYRNDERPKLAEEHPEMRVMNLERLSAEAVSELTQSMLGQAGRDPNLLSFVNKETEGNAFFMVEVVRALAEDAGQLSDVGRVTLPTEVYTGGIELIIRKRLMSVPEPYHPLLQLAAILGRFIDMDVMEYLVKGTDIDLNRFLLVCADASVLEVVDENWRFAHDKLRDGARRNIAVDKIASTYERAALALEAIYPDNTDYASFLIDLWRKAENPQKELHYILIEGHQLNEKTGLVNSRQAKVLFERAYQILPDTDNQAQAELDTILGIGIAAIGAGEMDTGSIWCDKAAKLALQLDEKPKAAQALVGLARAQMSEKTQDEIIAILDEAIRLVTASGDQRMIAVCRSVQGYIYAHFNDFDEALASFMAANAALEIDYVDYEIATTLNNIGKLHQVAGRYEKAKIELEKARHLAIQAGHYNSAILSTSNLGVTAYFCGDYAEAVEHYQNAIQIMSDTGDIAGLSHVWILRAYAEKELGDMHRVQRSITQAIKTRQMVNRDYSNIYIVMGGACLALMMRKSEQAAQWFGLAEKLGGANPFIREWLDPLQKELLTHFTRANLDSLIQQETELELEAAIQEIESILGGK